VKRRAVALPVRQAVLAVSAACALAGAAAPARADDAALGREKAQACAVCHGALGLSVTPDAPNLAGQPQIYVAAQLAAYRSGKRAHEVMAVMAKPLSDDDIRVLAAWYASLKVEVKAPS
jgi:cytochrome c553